METIYIAQSRCGLMKVGRTTNPKRRVQGLRKEFRKKGAELHRFEPCAPTTDGYRAENMLIELFSERLKAHSGREWFVGGLFENAVRAAREISEHIRETVPEVKAMTREERAAHTAKWAAYWAPIKAADKADKLKRRAEWLDRSERREAVKTFRATVCARIAASLIDADHPAPAEPSEAAHG